MVRLSHLPPHVAQGLLNLPLPELAGTPWTEAPPLAEARLVMVSTAGLHRRSDAKFVGGAADYRLIPGDVDPNQLIMSHVSVNFDRTGFQQDVNVVYPLELLRELAARGEVGSLATWHYSFMGATDPTRMEDSAHQLARLLRDDRVDAAILIPV
jgi:D-proline reductase (dithiol) PrdB